MERLRRVPRDLHAAGRAPGVRRARGRRPEPRPVPVCVRPVLKCEIVSGGVDGGKTEMGRSDRFGRTGAVVVDDERVSCRR